MKRPAVAFLLSLLTIFGGHCYNGRWAKACLFAVLLVVAAFLVTLVSYLGLVLFRPPEHSIARVMIDDVGRWKVFLGAVTAAVVVVWLLSARTAVRDARSEDGPDAGDSPLLRSLVSFALCAIAVVVLGVALMLATVGMMVRITPKGIDGLAELQPLLWRAGLTDPWFFLTASRPAPRGGYLGSSSGSWAQFDWESYKTLEAGSARIEGKVMATDEPVAGLRLRFGIAPDQRTLWAVTDDDGVYVVRVPPGKHTIAAYEVSYRSIPRLLDGKVEETGYWGTQGNGGFQVTAVADGVVTGPVIRFVDAIVRQHPVLHVRVPPDTIFEWEPYPKTAYYEIQVYDRGRRTDNRNKFWARTCKVHGTTATAEMTGYPLKKGHYYWWEVYAFDGKGNQLSWSGHGALDFKVE